LKQTPGQDLPKVSFSFRQQQSAVDLSFTASQQTICSGLDASFHFAVLRAAKISSKAILVKKNFPEDQK
jgi:hypothetical protein